MRLRKNLPKSNLKVNFVGNMPQGELKCTSFSMTIVQSFL